MFVGFLLLAGDSPFDGRICLTDSVGYSDDQIMALLKIPEASAHFYRSAKKKMAKFEKIRILEGNIIEIVNWPKYQSEYSRQKPYRKSEANQLLISPELQPEVISESDKQRLRGDRDRDRERDREGEKEEKQEEKRAGMTPAEYEGAIKSIKEVFEKRGFKDLSENRKLIDYIIDLGIEFAGIIEDPLEEVEKKIAHMMDHPPKPKSNLCLQFRNWFVNARKYQIETIRAQRVGGNRAAFRR